MSNLNASIRVTLTEEWRIHARMLPVGFTPLGTVKRKQYLQAFAVDQAGDYWAFGTGRPELLPRAKMERAIAAIRTGMPGGLGKESPTSSAYRIKPDSSYPGIKKADKRS